VDRGTGTFGLLSILIHWVVIYPVDSVSHLLKNWGQVCKIFGHHFIAQCKNVRELGKSLAVLFV